MENYILNRDFIVSDPYNKITEFKVKNGKIYLSAMYDLFSKKIISYKMSERPNSILALDALKDISPLISNNDTI